MEEETVNADDNMVAVDWTSDHEENPENSAVDVEMKSSGKEVTKELSENEKNLSKSGKSFLTHVVKGPVRVGTLDVTDLSNSNLQALLLKAKRSTFDFDRRKGMVTMWYDPDTPNVALEILGSLARLKLSSEDISIACPRAFAAVLATEKRREKFPDFAGGQKKDKSAYCNNIPLDTSEEVLRAIFPECSNVIIPRDEDGKNFCCAILEFKSGKAAQACIEGNKDIEVGDNKVSLGYCFPLPPDIEKKLKDDAVQQKKKPEKEKEETAKKQNRRRSSQMTSGKASNADKRTPQKTTGRFQNLGGKFSSSRLSASKVTRSIVKGVGNLARKRTTGIKPAPSTSMLMNQMKVLTNMVLNKQQDIAEQEKFARRLSSQSTGNMGGSMTGGRISDVSVSKMGGGINSDRGIGSNTGNYGGTSNMNKSRRGMSGSNTGMDDMESFGNTDWRSNSNRRNIAMEESDRGMDSFDDRNWQNRYDDDFESDRLDSSFGDVNRGFRETRDNQKNQMNQRRQGNRGGARRTTGGNKKKDSGCFSCGQDGHFARECPNTDRAGGGQGRQNRQNNRQNFGGRQTDFNTGLKRSLDDYDPRISDDVPFMTGIANQMDRDNDEDDVYDNFYTNKRRNTNFDDNRDRNRSNIGNQQRGNTGSGGARNRQRMNRGNLGDNSSDRYNQRTGMQNQQWDNSMSQSRRSPDVPRDTWTSAQSKWEQYMARQNQSEQPTGDSFGNRQYDFDDDYFY